MISTNNLKNVSVDLTNIAIKYHSITYIITKYHSFIPINYMNTIWKKLMIYMRN